MIRKLLLVGMVMLVDRGSVGQLALASIIAFIFLSMHLLCWPYKRPSDNILRAATEGHIFLAVMLALVLKHDLHHEKVQASFYEHLLFWSFIAMVPFAFIFLVWFKLREIVPLLRQHEDKQGKEHNDAASSTPDVVAARLHAFTMCKFGLADISQRKCLERWFKGWGVKKQYAVFISHYKDQAGAEARVLKQLLSRCLRTETEDQIFLDSDNLTNLSALRDHITQSDAVVVLLTKNFLSRPWCLVEMQTAVRERVPIIILPIKPSTHYLDPTDEQEGIASILDNLPAWLHANQYPIDHKAIVMSCPEMGTLKPDGSGPYDQNVMDKVSELSKLDFVHLGFDRAGTSTAVKTDEEKKKWSMAFDGTLATTEIGASIRSLGLDPIEAELRDIVDNLDTDGLKVYSDSGNCTILAGTIDFLDFLAIARKLNSTISEEILQKSFWKLAQTTPDDVKQQIFKSTDWWYGYQTSVKGIVKILSQEFKGTLDVTCIKGGPITQLEAAEMGRIMGEAEADCAKSGITVKYKITEVSYYDFLSEYEPALIHGDVETAAIADAARHGDAESPELATTDTDGLPDGSRAPEPEPTPAPELEQEDRGYQVTEYQPESEQPGSDQVTALRQVIELKDDELGRKDDEIALLKAHLRQLQQPSEGQPPM
jgi:hypothetical protein